MFVQINVISGLMCGIEILWEINTLVVDLGIIRVYIGLVPKEEE